MTCKQGVGIDDIVLRSYAPSVLKKSHGVPHTRPSISAIVTHCGGGGHM